MPWSTLVLSSSLLLSASNDLIDTENKLLWEKWDDRFPEQKSWLFRVLVCRYRFTQKPDDQFMISGWLQMKWVSHFSCIRGSYSFWPLVKWYFLPTALVEHSHLDHLWQLPWQTFEWDKLILILDYFDTFFVSPLGRKSVGKIWKFWKFSNKQIIRFSWSLCWEVSVG